MEEKFSDALVSNVKPRSLIDIDELSVEELDGIIKRACDIMENPAKYRNACEGKKLATLFYEPSTRTRLSFEAAMMELGGNVLGFSSASSASVSETLSPFDTEALEADEKPKTFPPSSIIAASKESLVLVYG